MPGGLVPSTVLAQQRLGVEAAGFCRHHILFVLATTRTAVDRVLLGVVNPRRGPIETRRMLPSKTLRRIFVLPHHLECPCQTDGRTDHRHANASRQKTKNPSAHSATTMTIPILSRKGAAVVSLAMYHM